MSTPITNITGRPITMWCTCTSPRWMFPGHQETPRRMARVLARRQTNVTIIPMSSTRAGNFSARKKDPSQKSYGDEGVMLQLG